MAGKFDIFLGAFRQKDVSSGGSNNYKGSYNTLLALETAHPTASNGDFAIVNGSVDAMFIWDDDSSGWIKNSSRNGSYPEVANYTSLPSAADHPAEIYVALAASGVYMVNRKPAGLYISNGTTWTKLNNFVEAFNDANMRIYNNSDDTKGIRFDTSNVTTGNFRTLESPDKDGIIALTSDISSGGTSDEVSLKNLIDNLYLTRYYEKIYTAEGQLIEINFWDTNAKTNHLYKIERTYTDGFLTQTVITQTGGKTMTINKEFTLGVHTGGNFEIT